MIKFCPYCGVELKRKEKFCASCGRNLTLKGRRLYRFPGKGILGGVCYGIADFLEIDPTLVRALAVILTLVWLPTLLLYSFFWLLFPQQEELD